MLKNPANLINHVRSWLIPIALLLLLSGCGFATKQIEVVSAPLDRVPLNLPKTDQLKTDPVEWFVVTPDNADDVFSLLEKQGTDTVIFGVTDDGYENLSVNIAKILKLIQQQKSIIDAYEQYYVQQERAIDRHLRELNQLKDSVTKQ